MRTRVLARCAVAMLVVAACGQQVPAAAPVTGATDGPQLTSGEGWRLLSRQPYRGAPYSAHVAVNAIEYESLWASLGSRGDPEPADFGSEIVIHFGAVFSGSCPDIRFDGLEIAGSSVTANVVVLGNNQECTADANSRPYVVAVEKSVLPPLPFTVSLQNDCEWCQSREVTDFIGTASPVPDLSEWDRMQILAAGARTLFGSTIDASQRVDVIEVVGRATDDGMVDFDESTALTEAERNWITHVFGSHPVNFVPRPKPADLATQPHYNGGDNIVSLAAPVVRMGSLTVTAGLWCGNLCGWAVRSSSSVRTTAHGGSLMEPT